MTHWGGVDADSKSWTTTGADAKAWSQSAAPTANLWNRLQPFPDAGGGIDFRPVIGGGWVIGEQGDSRNVIRIGSNYTKREP